MGGLRTREKGGIRTRGKGGIRTRGKGGRGRNTVFQKIIFSERWLP